MNELGAAAGGFVAGVLTTVALMRVLMPLLLRTRRKVDDDE